jgi:nucleotide-binding universal stress UspA family protein
VRSTRRSGRELLRRKAVFRQIMTPLDGSPPAERALPYAAQVAAVTGASVHLVRVVEPPIADSTTAAQPVAPMDAAKAVRAAAQAEAAGYLDAVRARPELGGIQVQVQVPVSSQPGTAAATLLDYERDAGIDLVVATTRSMPASRSTAPSRPSGRCGWWTSWAGRSCAKRLCSR